MSDERVITLKDEEFRVTYPVPPMALAEFAHIAQGGADSNDLAGFAAMYELLESVIEPDEWDRFKRHAKKTRASGDDLMTVVRKVISGQADRPTSRPSDSSDGPSSTEQKSESAPEPSADSVHARVIRMHEKAGRPDKALIVLQAQEHQMASAV